MEKIYTGKTKDVFKHSQEKLMFYFKDEVTGENGVIDPGANSVLGQISGKGRMSLELSQYYFNLLEKNSVPTHFIKAIPAEGYMEVKNARPPGEHLSPTGGLEFICRLKAYGSFVKRYQKYVKEELQELPYLVEITLKDDEKGDPLINDDAIVALDILSENQLFQGKQYTRQASKVIAHDLEQKGLSLLDIKFEFGLYGNDVILIDEVSADAMRVMDQSQKILSHQEIYQQVLETS